MKQTRIGAGLVAALITNACVAQDLKSPSSRGLCAGPEEVAVQSATIPHSLEPASVDLPSCNDNLKVVVCRSIQLTIPEDAIVISAQRQVREIEGNWIATEDPHKDIGWSTWDGSLNRSLDAANHAWVFSTAFRNWKHDRDREIQVVVHFKRMTACQ